MCLTVVRLPLQKPIWADACAAKPAKINLAFAH